MTTTRMMDHRLYINWGTGTDADTTAYNTVTSDKVMRSSVHLTLGRDKARQTAPPKTEALEFVLNNYDGTYNNISGPLAGFVTRGPTVQWILLRDTGVTVDSTDVTLDDEDWSVDDPIAYTMFDGIINNVQHDIGQMKIASVDCLGRMRLLTNKKLTLDLDTNTTMDAELNRICDAINFPSAYRFFDVGDTTYLYAWMHDEDIMQYLLKLLAAEGGGAALIMDESGLHFQGRQYRVNNYRSVNVQWYLFDKLQTSDPLFRKPIYYTVPAILNENEEDVVNKANTTTIYRVAGTSGQVWSYGSVLELGPNEVRTIHLSVDVPIIDAFVPVITTDYLVSSGSVTLVEMESLTGSRIGVRITAGAGGATITGPSGQESDGIYVRAKRLDVQSESDIDSRVDTSDSIDRYGENQLEISLWPEINPNVAQDIVDGIVRRYRNPRDQLTLTIYNNDGNHSMFILNVKVSDRIHVVSTHQGINSDFFVETKSVQSLGNGLFSCTIECERALDEDAFRFGIDTFGNNVFGE